MRAVRRARFASSVRDVGVFVGDALVEESDGAFVESPGLALVASSSADHAERAERRHRLGMIWAEPVLFDRHGAAQTRIRALEIAEASVGGAEAAERHADLVLGGSEGALEHRERVLEQRRGFVLAAGASRIDISAARSAAVSG
jgi:hypothetical protein